MDVLLINGSTNNYARIIVINVYYQRKTKDLATQAFAGAGSVGFGPAGRADRQAVLSSVLDDWVDGAVWKRWGMERHPSTRPVTGADALSCQNP